MVVRWRYGFLPTHGKQKVATKWGMPLLAASAVTCVLPIGDAKGAVATTKLPISGVRALQVAPSFSVVAVAKRLCYLFGIECIKAFGKIEVVFIFREYAVALSVASGYKPVVCAFTMRGARDTLDKFLFGPCVGYCACFSKRMQNVLRKIVIHACTAHGVRNSIVSHAQSVCRRMRSLRWCVLHKDEQHLVVYFELFKIQAFIAKSHAFFHLQFRWS